MAALALWVQGLEGGRNPAELAGVGSLVRFDAQRSSLLHFINNLGQPIFAVNRTETIIHQTLALDALFSADPESSTVLSAMRGRAAARFAECVCTESTASHTISTERASYRFQCSMFSDPGCVDGQLTLVALSTVTRPQPSAVVLQARFGMTVSESRVALLAEGMSNSHVAERLGTSPHTARRHTERVFKKVSLRSRAEVDARLFASHE